MSGISGAGPDSYPTAELDRRFYAFAIDRLLGLAIYGAAVYVAYLLFFQDGRVLPGVALIVGVVVAVSLVMGFVLGLLGTSPGKAAVGLRVVDDSTGTPIGVGPALMRTIVLDAAALPVGLGVATLAFTAMTDPDRQRRGWHDHLAKSVVVDVRPAPVEEEAVPDRPRQIVNLTAMRLVPASPTPPREVPARVRRSRWAAGPSNPESDVPPPAQAAPVVAASVPVPAAPAPAPVAAPVAPVTQPEPAAPADPDALAMPVAPVEPVAPAKRRAVDLGDALADPSSPRTPGRPPASSGMSRPAAAERPRPRHAAPEPTPAAAAPVAAAPTPQARSTGRWSVAFDTGDAFVVDGFTLVGRNPEPRSGEPVKRLVALPSQDMSLSKTHAQFQVVPDGAMVVMDRGSTNGSILIRGGVTRELGPGKPATLRDGDVVRFGDREMRVSLEPGPA